ncbi:glycosyltransferase [Halomonas piscis]|uniref:Glycosyltransferase n=1 Tax=Halomonas piscis TaxID=3031727 RepID=A0ABY9YZ28_9GAMM|nr:glycosyltransferase [Halomonas piscis]WNK20129.1 glycosyltransferase [Halomonas piscis]
MAIVFHVITGLNNGGAEAVLYRLVTNDESNHHTVISLMDMGKYGPMLEEKGVGLVCLNMPKGKVTVSGLINLFLTLRKYKPDVVQTWMYHADLIGGAVARLAGVKCVFWNIRHTDLMPGESSKKTIFIARICAFLSSFVPFKILCCAEKSVKVHSGLGYKKEKMLVVGNGYQLDKFDCNVGERLRLRNEISLTDGFVLGMVGRFDPQKDHRNLVNALGLLKKRGVDFKCLLVGPGMDYENVKMLELISHNNLQEEVLLLGQRSDIPALMNVLDIHVLSSSFGEAFPNVVAEAMACGTPCVTTDVGDAALIVGETGWVVPAKKTEKLADAIEQGFLECQQRPLDWKDRKISCRERIEDNFSIEKMVEKYNAAWSCD